MSYHYLQLVASLPLPPHPSCYRRHHRKRKKKGSSSDFRMGSKTVSYARYGNFTEGKYFTCDELCATTRPQSTIPLPQGVNNIPCALLGKVKVSTDMISALLHFNLSLIKGSHSHSAVRVTHLISPSAPQRAEAVQAAR